MSEPEKQNTVGNSVKEDMIRALEDAKIRTGKFKLIKEEYTHDYGRHVYVDSEGHEIERTRFYRHTSFNGTRF